MRQSKPFQFKQFTIHQDNCGMPVSTDGVLLGAWANLKGKVLDIGAGTGLLSLMAAQRDPNIAITGIELEVGAYTTAQKNIVNSPWKDRIKLLHQDILSFDSPSSFNTIICNPPYFVSGETAQNKARADARHTQSLTHASLLKVCYDLLTNEGRASFILPFDEGKTFIELAKQQGFHLTRSTHVHTTERKPCQRLLIQISKLAAPLESKNLVISEGSVYTSEFISLTKDFYLKM